MALDVLIPQHRQRDVLALELAVDLAPIGLDVTPMTLFGADRSEQYRFQRAVGHLSRQRPAEPRACQPFNVNRTVDDATPTRRAISLSPTPAVLKRSTSRTRRIGNVSAGIRF